MRTNGPTDSHDKANRSISSLCERALKDALDAIHEALNPIHLRIALLLSLYKRLFHNIFFSSAFLIKTLQTFEYPARATCPTNPP